MEGSVPDPDLIDKIRAECRRVELLLPQFATHPTAGSLAQDILKVVLREGEASIASGDVERMKRSLDSLRNVPRQ
jgi:hypothetical protein